MTSTSSQGADFLPHDSWMTQTAAFLLCFLHLRISLQESLVLGLQMNYIRKYINHTESLHGHISYILYVYIMYTLCIHLCII